MRTEALRWGVNDLGGTLMEESISRMAGSQLAAADGVNQHRPDVHAIVHTHSPFAVAWGMTGDPLPPVTEDAEYYSLGTVPITPYVPSGTAGPAASATSRLQTSDATLLARHGVVSVAADLQRALQIARVVVHIAQIAIVTRQWSCAFTITGSEGGTPRPAMPLP